MFALVPNWMEFIAINIWVLFITINVYAQNCPERQGLFPDPQFCDKYLECRNGTGVVKTCPDGLLFDDRSTSYHYPCVYPIEVDCGSRTQTRKSSVELADTTKIASEPAQPTPLCPHQFAIFFSGDSSRCDLFTSCVYGFPYHFKCPKGLAFNPDTLRCDWPDHSSICDPEQYLGFRCPADLPDTPFPGFFQKYPHPDPSKCNIFLICLQDIKNRWTPRQQSCEEGKGFNPESLTCEDLELLPSCKPENFKVDNSLEALARI